MTTVFNATSETTSLRCLARDSRGNNRRRYSRLLPPDTRGKIRILHSALDLADT
jgi:hypothetical protein